VGIQTDEKPLDEADNPIIDAGNDGDDYIDGISEE